MSRFCELGSDVPLTCTKVETLALAELGPHLFLSPATRARMEASLQCRRQLEAAGIPIYGVTTGFGPFVHHSGAGESQGMRLLNHLSVGWGPATTPTVTDTVVRATFWIRAQNLAQGWSGVSPDLLTQYLALPQRGVVPCVPPVGSVGASGDLIPLAHITRAVMGAEESFCRVGGRVLPAREALRSVGLTPVVLDSREALALTNGTSFLTAYAALAVARAERLLLQAERLTGWLYRSLGAQGNALEPRVHQARGHRNQERSAQHIRVEAERFGPYTMPDRALQEVYSLRCAPQVLGACRDNYEQARQVVETEINGVSDNPLFDPEAGAVLHGGNFQGQQVAFAADILNAALTQVAVLAERQLAALVTPSSINRQAPLLLAWNPGENSGLAGVQLTATALVAEMRSHAQMHSTYSIPTNGGNQDVVSMGTLAARSAWEQTERLAAVLAALALALAQFDFLQRSGHASGGFTAPPVDFPAFSAVTLDRPLQDDLQRIATHFLHPNSLLSPKERED